MKPIKIYYHIADLDGWQELVDEKISLMKNYGLWNNASEIQLLLHYERKSFKSWVTNFKDDPRVKLIYFDSSCRPLGESYSNRYIWKDCWNTKEEFFLLRFHTKGLIQKNTQYWPVAVKWNEYLDYFNLEKWKDCVQALENGFDLAGTNWHPPNHFSGNIWWARSSHVKKLPLLISPHLVNNAQQISFSYDTRHDAELWVGLRDAKVKEFHHYEHGCVYNVPTPENYKPL